MGEAPAALAPSRPEEHNERTVMTLPLMPARLPQAPAHPPATLPADPDWLVLHDVPGRGVSPLALDLLRLEVEGRARQLTAALGVTDPERWHARLFAVHAGRACLHGPHLRALTAGLEHPVQVAFHAALGVAAAVPEPALPDARLRLDLLRLPALRAAVVPGAPTPHGPDAAARLLHACEVLTTHPGTMTPFAAALSAGVLGAALRHWLDQREALPLDWLCGLGGPDTPGHAMHARADRQAGTTLSGARRGQYRSLVQDTRRHQQALEDWEALRERTYRAALRAALRLGQALTARGTLARAGDVRLLRVEELLAAADGRLPALDVRTLIRLRREASRPKAATEGRGVLATRWHATPLAPGVRDGRLQRWDGAVLPELPGPDAPPLVLLGPAPTRRPWPFPETVAGLLLTDCLPFGPSARRAREGGLAALSLPADLAAALPDGALVRLDAYRGTVTVLQEAVGLTPHRPDPDPERPASARPPVPEMPSLPLLLNMEF